MLPFPVRVYLLMMKRGGYGHISLAEQETNKGNAGPKESATLL